MDPTQWAALDLLTQLAEECAFNTRFEIGDMQFLNSHVTYHARDAFEDDTVNGYRRCLYLIWLCAVANHRKLPPGQEILWGATYPGQLRGGIAQR